MADMTARQELKDAHTLVRITENHLAEMKAALKETLERHAAAEEEFAQMSSGLEEEISKFRLEAIRQKSDPRKYPRELKARMNERRDMEEEIERSQHDRAFVEDAVKQAERDLLTAKDKHARAVIAVVRESTDGIAAEIEAMRKKHAQLQDVLASLGSIELPTLGRVGLSFANLPYGLMFLAHSGMVPQADGSASFYSEWLAIIRELAKNPDYEFGLPGLGAAA